MRSRFLLSFLLFASPSLALTIDKPLPDATQEQRAKALFHDIRCVVCQGETIADSQAEIARDLRRIIRADIASGKSEDAIKAKLTSRYGDSILMRPPIKPATWPLWFGPWLILGAGGLAAYLYFRKRA